MIDLHSHVLPGLDDGAQDIDTSILMLDMAVKAGTTHIFATPHYIKDDLENNSGLVRNTINTVNEIIRLKGIDIKVMSGNEVFICPELPFLVSTGEVCTLNDSSYVLVELPMLDIPLYTKDVIFNLKLKGYTPIIAHPERNKKIYSNLNIVYDLVQCGALMQINSTSINGMFGSEIKKAAFELISHNLAHFVASDAHTLRGRSPKLSKCREQVAERFGKDIADMLFVENGRSVIENKQIIIREPKRIKNKNNFFVNSLMKILPW